MQSETSAWKYQPVVTDTSPAGAVSGAGSTRYRCISKPEEAKPVSEVTKKKKKKK